MAGQSRQNSSAKSWRVVDIVVTSVLGIAVGIVFWVWSTSWETLSLPFNAFPPAAGLLTGVWVLAGVLAGIIIRKPGAALYCEILAAAVSMAFGTQWGWQVLLSGLIQGIGAELVFLLAGYKFRGSVWNLFLCLFAGLGAGIFLAIGENILYNAAWAFTWKLIYTGCAAVSGVVLAGFVSWLAWQSLARTGALSAFASGHLGKEI